MSNIKLRAKVSFFLSRIVNLSLKTVFNRFILFLSIFLLYSSLIFKSNYLKLITAECLISFILALIFKRVSENINMNRITGTLNMNVQKPSEYWKYSYISDKKIISEKLKQNFISGIINASRYKKKLKTSTHKWVIEEVMNSDEIKSIFDVEIIEKKKQMKLKAEILIIVSKDEFKKNTDEIYEKTRRKRDSFTVVLKRK